MIKKLIGLWRKINIRGFCGLVKALRDWMIMSSVAALTIGVFHEKNDLAALIGIVAFVVSLALGLYLERRPK
jgi:hypothetical membrane protein